MKKVINIIEIDIKSLVDIFVTYEPGIRFTTVSPDIDAGFIDENGNRWFFQGQGSKEVAVQAVRLIDKTTLEVFDMLPTTSLENLRLQQNGFFYDSDTTNLFLNIADNFDISYKYLRNVGQTVGFVDKVDETRLEKSYYNNLYYNPLVKTAPSVSYLKDTLYYGVFKFPSFNCTFINEDGFFDEYGKNIYNNSIIYRQGYEGDEYEDFVKLYDGIVQNYSTTDSEFKITGKDKRVTFTRNIPINVLTDKEWQYLNDNNKNKVKPLAWGSVRNVEPIVLNEEQSSPSNYLFYLCENLSSVEAVRINGSNYTGYTENISEGYISIPYADATTDDSLDDITVDFTGGVANGIRIIQEIANDYLGIAYTTDNYDTEAWSNAVINGKDYTLYLNDKEEIKKIFEAISFSQFGLLDVTKEGKLTFRNFERKDQIKTALLYDDWKNDPTRKEDPNEFLTRATFNYDKDYKNDAWRTYEDAKNEGVLLQKYGLHKEKSFEVNLKNLSDVENLSANIIEDRKDIILTYQRTLDLKGGNVGVEFKNIEIGDIITAAHDRNQEDYNVYEVTGVTYDTENESIKLDQRFIKDLVLSDFVKQNFYKCEGSILSTGVDYNPLENIDFTFIDENINYYDAGFYNEIKYAPNMCYYSTLNESLVDGFTQIEFDLTKTGGKVWFQLREILPSGLIPNFYNLVELNDGANVIALNKLKYFQYRIFSSNMTTESINIVQTNLI